MSDTAGIVERLRAGTAIATDSLMFEAASLIESLTAERDGAIETKEAAIALMDKTIQDAFLATVNLERRAAEARAKAIEDCAKVVEGGYFLHDEAPPAVWARQVAKLIRALKDKPDA